MRICSVAREPQPTPAVKRSRSTRSKVDAFAVGLTAVALGLGWLIYRLERSAARKREINAAWAVLGAVRRSMIEGVGGCPAGDGSISRLCTAQLRAQIVRVRTSR
jgi:hypothetical protein